ncbi:hypothetical protein QFZ33_000251 [Arthrobacter globiformis]|nr:hypothetical protein [Arthrobacter globiformis]
MCGRICGRRGGWKCGSRLRISWQRIGGYGTRGSGWLSWGRSLRPGNRFRLSGVRDDFDGGRADVVGRFLHNFHHDNGDVVRRARLEGEVNERLDAFAQIRRFPHGALHDVARDVIQTVGAEQPALSGLHIDGGEVQFGARIDVTEDAHQDVLVRMGFRFFGPQPTLVDESLDERVVDADLFELAVAQAVGAGIADVGEMELALGQQQGSHGGAHARQLGIDVNEFREQRVGGLDLVGQHGAGVVIVVVGVQMEHVQDSGGGSNIAAGVAAHAVRHDGQVPSHVGGVVVLRADAADVRTRRIAQDKGPRRGWHLAGGHVRSGHGYGLNSMTVLPILTGTPRSTGRALVSCWSAR